MAEIDGDDEVVKYITICDIYMPVAAIQTFGIEDEYNHRALGFNRYIVINKSHMNNQSVYANIKIKCGSIQHRDELITHIKKNMEAESRKFI